MVLFAPPMASAPGGPAGLIASAFAALALLRVALFFFRLLVGVYRYRRMPLPAAPDPSPLLGHVAAMMSDQSPRTLDAWSRALGPLFKMRFLSETAVSIADPAAAAKVLRAASEKPEAYFGFDLPSAEGHSMFTHPGGAYARAVRAGIAPCFATASLKRTFPWLQHIVALAADDVADSAARGEPVDVSDLGARVTSDVVGDLLFGSDLGGMRRRRRVTEARRRRQLQAAGAAAAEAGAAEEEVVVEEDEEDAEAESWLRRVRAYLGAVSWRSNDPFHRWRFGPTARRHRAALADWDDAVDRLARRVLSAAAAGNPPPEHSIAGRLLSSVADPATNKALTLSQLKQELSVLFIAGFETTAHAISWTLALLAAHPEKQEILAQELEAAGLAPSSSPSPSHGGADGDGGDGRGGERRAPPRAFEWGDLAAGRLPYLSAVLRESLRLYQPASGGSLRRLTADVELPDPKGAGGGGSPIKLPAGTLVAVSLFALGRDRQNYGDDADVFRPERWPAASRRATADNEDERRPPSSAGGGGGGGAAASPPDPMPFAAGPRDCIGQALANLELQAVIATLVGRFRFSPAPGGASSIRELDELTCYHITLFPKGGMRLMATPR